MNKTMDWLRKILYKLFGIDLSHNCGFCKHHFCPLPDRKTVCELGHPIKIKDYICYCSYGEKFYPFECRADKLRCKDFIK